MKKALRAAVLTLVLFAGANVQGMRGQSDDAGPQITTAGSGGACYYINGVWFCDS